MARQRAGLEATQAGRELAGDSGAPGPVTRVPAPAMEGLRTATRPDKKHAAGTVLILFALAAGNGAPAGGFPGIPGHAGTAGKMPAAEWARRARLRAAGARSGCGRTRGDPPAVRPAPGAGIGATNSPQPCISKTG